MGPQMKHSSDLDDDDFCYVPSSITSDLKKQRPMSMMGHQTKQSSNLDDEDFCNVPSSRTSDVKKPRGSITSKSTTTRRSVAFNRSVKVHLGLHLVDFTREEVAASWYSRTEMAAMKQDAKVAAKTLETLGLRKCHADPNFCVRGLEIRTTAGSRARMQSKISARKTVMQEQRRQLSEGRVDPKYIAVLYMTDCRDSQVMAHELGIDDEHDVKQLWREQQQQQRPSIHGRK
jgi:hypothetical protein